MINNAADLPVEWAQNFHIGFELASLDEVRALYEQMAGAGVVMKSGVLKHERGSRFFCEAPGGLLVEINTRLDADEKYRGIFDL
ncbi:VOC family protein [Paraburkholderia sp. BL27I4N3]|uniref:VOC family protein n=1 Tax=unclassified Paraburkholderia TaxID=2615204 RepID=UPI0026858565|nr:VOC family protein [Paraburkholderia sp. BL27I4N3]